MPAEAMRPTDLLEISDEAGILSFCALAEFVEANADDAEVCAQARGLSRDQSFRTGGGAAPIFDIRRASTTTSGPAAGGDMVGTSREVASESAS